ncbi:MAG: D-glycero-beta-D-manno-heptose-7-phosphate kinase [Alphaproteobacteria bacterium]|nr:D-glycero-beta-D-manno-heptose-7-phosphate kinase [Alphaproteobacteria bacterium]
MTDRTAHLQAVLDQVAGRRVLCVGDAMLDLFVYGAVDRISPEGPIPILTVERQETMPGGAANVVRNLAALGAETCFVSLAGGDEAGRSLTRLIGKHDSVESHLLVDHKRQTTVKERYVAGGQQLLRADRENVHAVSGVLAEDLMERAVAEVETTGALILSDYGKGVLTPDICRALIEKATLAGKPVIVDPKGDDYERYRGATVVTPNRKELALATRMPVGTTEEIAAAANHLLDHYDLTAVLVTRSDEGMSLFVRGEPPAHEPANVKKVYDVSGAGDTVVALMGAVLAVGESLSTAMALANVAAGIVVGKPGTAIAETREIRDSFSGTLDRIAHGKLEDLDGALTQVADWRERGYSIGFTNGCFDLLHPGHVSLLTQAKERCDRLILGLNSDASIRRLKGETRPVNSVEARAAVLAGLASVDLLVVFDEDTPINLISAVKPDVLVKGADYTVETVVGSEVVLAYGGKVHLAELEDGFSTTKTIEKMKA